MALRIIGLLLAAGRGERFGGDKLLASLPAPDDGVPVGVAACRTLLAACSEVVAVVRPGDAAIAALFAAAGARVVECANADAGMGASLACGVDATRDADGWIVALADMPWIAHSTLVSVRTALEGGAVVGAPFYRGERGHPVGFGRVCGPALAALTGDEGAKGVVAARRAELVRIDVDDAGTVRDVDTPGDLVPGAG